jgi:hypothetical protein
LAGAATRRPTCPCNRGHYADAAAALAWTLAWPDYRETAARLTEQGGCAFENRALAAADDTSKDWWFEINYFVATKPPGKDARYC